MLKKEEVITKLQNGDLDDAIKELYVTDDASCQRERYMSVINGYADPELKYSSVIKKKSSKKKEKTA